MALVLLPPDKFTKQSCRQHFGQKFKTLMVGKPPLMHFLHIVSNKAVD